MKSGLLNSSSSSTGWKQDKPAIFSLLPNTPLPLNGFKSTFGGVYSEWAEPQLDIFYTIDELGVLFKCSRRFIENLISDKLLTVYRVGNVIRIRLSDFLKLAGH